jgi:hypothetical protein
MHDPRRRLGRMFRPRHRRAKNRRTAGIVACPRGDERRQRLQQECIDEQNAHRVARQISQLLSPAAACHGLPTVISDETLTRLPWRCNVQRERLDRRRARV